MAKSIQELNKICLDNEKAKEKAQNNILLFRKLSLNDKSYNARITQQEELLKKYNKIYNDNNCDENIGNIKVGQTLSTIQSFQEIDKKRIEADTKKMVTRRIYFGVGLVVVATLLIIVTTKKNGSNI
jgi:hypothetical protein